MCSHRPTPTVSACLSCGSWSDSRWGSSSQASARSDRSIEVSIARGVTCGRSKQQRVGGSQATRHRAIHAAGAQLRTPVSATVPFVSVARALGETMKLRSGTFRLGASAAVAFALAFGIVTSASIASAAGPAPVGLGTAAAFAVLAGTPSITNTGATVINGDLGIHPAASVTGFPPGTVSGTIHTADAVALQAKSDLVSAYSDAAARPATATHGTLGGLTLVGGVYNAGGVTLGLTGTLTLDGQNDPSSVWIFQATSDL